MRMLRTLVMEGQAQMDTKEWDALAELDIFGETDALWPMWGDNRKSTCKEFLVVRMPSVDVDVGETGTAVVVGSSRETRLVVLTDIPALK
jgi:hypothetical protein